MQSLSQSLSGLSATDPSLWLALGAGLVVIMTFLFLGFPSGLVIYWLTNNILTIIQLQVYNRQQKAAQ